jgi:hypothetical protein
VPRDKAVKQLDELKRQFDEDIKISQELGLKMGERMKEFQNANNKILDKDPNARAILNAEKLSVADSTKETVAMEAEVVKSPYNEKKTPKNNKTVQPPPSKVINKSANKVQAPVAKSPVVSKSPAVEVAHVTETNQIKQKAFVDQIGQAKAQAKVAFALEGTVSFATPENMICGL